MLILTYNLTEYFLYVKHVTNIHKGNHFIFILYSILYLYFIAFTFIILILIEYVDNVNCIDMLTPN